MSPVTLEGFLGASDVVTERFLSEVYPAIAGILEPPITYLAWIYWALLGYKVYAGYAALEWREVLVRVLMTCTVFGMLNWGGLASQFYRMVVSLMDTMAGTLMAGEPSATLLDGLLTSADHISLTLRSSDFYQINAILEGALILILNCVLFTIAVFLMTISKLGLAILMVLLPLFIGFALFQATRHWFVNWLNSVLNFSLIYILVIAIVKLSFVAFAEYIDEVGQAASYLEARYITSVMVTNLCVVEFVLIAFMLQVKDWAAALSGGVSVQGGAIVIRMVNEIRSLK